ncbi:MAG: NUDIX domain-containing protein [bacterium]|nr:NUDIX domain-containing protein [bacterium]
MTVQETADRNEEHEFLAAYDATEFDRPSLAVDVAILTVIGGGLEVALVERAEHPNKGHWALPGGFVRMDESLDRAATRVLTEKAGLADVYLEQLYTFGDPGRDPRTRVVSVGYYALVDHARLATSQDSNLTFGRIDVPWEGETGGPVEARSPQGQDMPLAFDHADILGMAVKRIRGKLDYTPIGFQLLAETFTLRRLQDVHETILGRTLNKDSFRRRMLASGLLEATGERETEVGHRPAELYRFTKRSAI